MDIKLEIELLQDRLEQLEMAVVKLEDKVFVKRNIGVMELDDVDMLKLNNWFLNLEMPKKTMYFTVRDVIVLAGLDSKGMMWKRAVAKYLESVLMIAREPAAARRFKIK